MKIEFTNKIKNDFSLLTKGFIFFISFIVMSVVTGQIILLIETGHSSLENITATLYFGIMGGVANIVLFFPLMLIIKYIKSNITINKG